MFRIRIIPATIVIASLMLAVKVVDIVRGTESLSQQLLIPTVSAQTQAPEPKKDEKSSEEKKAAEAAKDKGGEAKKEDSEASAQSGDGTKEGKKNPAVSDDPGPTVDRRFTNVEIELLQNLAKRREELDRWEHNITIKEAALDATQKRVEEKIAQIEAMKTEVGALLAQYNEKEDAKIRSLVKIYENMKPKDAARIFDEVEMPILLLVIDKMSEKKAAPILAQMDPMKAKQITVQLAEQRRVTTTRLNPNLSPKTATE